MSKTWEYVKDAAEGGDPRRDGEPSLVLRFDGHTRCHVAELDAKGREQLRADVEGDAAGAIRRAVVDVLRTHRVNLSLSNPN